MKSRIIAMAAIFASAGALVQAQTSDTTGITAINDRIDEIQTAASDDIARGNDASRFGNPEFNPGLSGSASLSYFGQNGNNKSQDFTAGGRLRYAAGPIIQTFGFAVDYADVAGVRSKQDIFAVYDANYYFNDKLYGFVLGRIQANLLATTENETATDAFLGFGPGYRILNTEIVTWRVQIGVGQSYLKDGNGTSETEIGYIASSRLFYAFNESIFLSDDTDVLKTNSSLRVNNDMGVNFKVSDTVSTRLSYLTEYNDSRAIRSDNKVGISVVFGF